MKRLMALVLTLVCMLSLASCKNEAQSAGKGSELYSFSESATQTPITPPDGEGNPSDEGSIPDDYYQMATSESAMKVEQFAAEIKHDILSGNWESLSKKLAYPIQIGGKQIESSSDFLDMNMDDTLSQEFVEAIAAESCHEMFVNANGIMMGASGQIWISDVMVGTNQWALKVIAMNGISAEGLSAE